MPKDRGAEQGVVDEPLEFIQALGMVAAEARRRTSQPLMEGGCTTLTSTAPTLT